MMRSSSFVSKKGKTTRRKVKDRRTPSLPSDGTQNASSRSTRKVKASSKRKVAKKEEKVREPSSTKEKERSGRPVCTSNKEQRNNFEPPGKKAMREFVLQACKAGVNGLLAEFNEIKKQTQAIGETPKAAFDSNPTKNRYKDVFCVDQDRVVLSSSSDCPGDYIHGNWAETCDGRKYICTQGPIPSTIEDFWRMVLQEQCKCIIMLCNIIEAGKKKCEQYWPAEVEEQATYGKITVQNTKKEEWIEIMTVTTLTVTDSKNSLTVQHIQWNNWPDRGVPRETMACLQLIRRVSTLSPVVIHCSAGIGRTGTIVAFDQAYTKMLRGETVSFKQLLVDLRMRRHGSIQTDMQYVFVHKVLVDIALSRMVVTADEVKEFLGKYEELCTARGM